MSARRRWSVVLALVGLAFAVLVGRAAFVQAFFFDGAPSAAPPLTPEPAGAAALPRSDRVRVLLLDGLSAERADALPNLGALCREGLDLRVDTGFPTVSLPVQHVLWTGRTQAQSGVGYRIPRLPSPPHDALGRRVPGSIGVAESHADIVGSFGFGQALPPLDDVEREAAGSAWRREGFSAAALEAVASSARLVFVHVLRIDEAGHAAGAASPEYIAAAEHGDALLASLRAAAGADAMWLVLADHGHLAGGGHGGAEDEIRVVRACVVGPGIEAGDHRARAPIHLVDVHRGLAQALGLSDRSSGRSIAFALEHPDPGATLPQPSPGRWIAALMLALVGVGAVGLAAGRRVRAWPWWLAVAYLSIVVIHGLPTLSNPMIYPRQPSAMLLASLPGAVVLALAARAGLRRDGLLATLVAQGGLLVALVLGGLVLCGGMPPLMPSWTAHTSVGLVLLALGSTVLAMLVAMGDRGAARPAP